MSKTLDVPLSDIKFHSSCVVCLSPSSKKFTLEKTFTYGRRSYTVKVPVPMCGQHFDSASSKGLLEGFFTGLAIYGGIPVGILTAYLMFSRWEGDVNIIGKLFGSSIFGFGGFILFWWIVSASIAPIFAAPASKEARHAVQIAFYWPQTKTIRLHFKNETVFTLTQKENYS
jgi:hypothetical protein